MLLKPRGANGTLDDGQLGYVLLPLFAAREHKPELVETYVTIAEAWKHAATRPKPANLEVLDVGLAVFPRDIPLLLAATAFGQTYHTYIGNLDQQSATVAWGTTHRGSANTIGRDSVPEGKGFVGGKALTKAFAKGTDEWSHPYRAPDNNPQSADTVLKRPFMTHYMAEPWYCPLPMQSVISGGRIFKVFGDRSSAKPQEPLINKLLANIIGMTPA